MWLEGPLPDELTRFPGYLMARLGQVSSRRFAESLAPLELAPREFGVLNILAANPGATQQALSERTGIDTSSMTALLDDLERRGVAERRPHPEDRRARSIHLTAAGEQTLAQGRRLAARVQRQLLHGLSDEEQQVLQQLLLKLARSFAGGDGGADR